MSEEQPREPVKRSEKAKARGRKRYFKFCRTHSPSANPHRYRDVYPRWWTPILIEERK